MKQMILIVATLFAASIGTPTFGATNNEPQVTKEYKLSGFSGLLVDHAVNIEYTQGDSYSIKAEGTEKQIERLIVEVSNGVLKISHQKDKKNNGENKSVKFYITCPKMESITNNGVLRFEADKLKADDFKLKGKGVSNFHINHMKLRDATFEYSGVTNFEMEIEAKSLTLQDNGVTNGDIKIKADLLSIQSSGVNNLSFNFKGKEVKVNKSGTGTIELEVDCEHLEARNSGVGKLSISGTADDTKIENSGVTKIDVKKLNQF